MGKRRKIWDHVDVLCLDSFDKFIDDLKKTRRIIMKKYPEVKKSDIAISIGPLNHCVHVDFLRWATEEEIKDWEKRREEVRIELFGDQDEENSIDDL